MARGASCVPPRPDLVSNSRAGTNGATAPVVEASSGPDVAGHVDHQLQRPDRAVVQVDRAVSADGGEDEVAHRLPGGEVQIGRSGPGRRIAGPGRDVTARGRTQRGHVQHHRGDTAGHAAEAGRVQPQRRARGQLPTVLARSGVEQTRRRQRNHGTRIRRHAGDARPDVAGDVDDQLQGSDRAVVQIDRAVRADRRQHQVAHRPPGAEVQTGRAGPRQPAGPDGDVSTRGRAQRGHVQHHGGDIRAWHATFPSATVRFSVARAASCPPPPPERVSSSRAGVSGTTAPAPGSGGAADADGLLATWAAPSSAKDASRANDLDRQRDKVIAPQNGGSTEFMIILDWSPGGKSRP